MAWRSAQSLYACMHVINASVDHAWLLFNSNVTAPVHQTIVLCETCNLAQGVLSICPGHLHLVCMWIINEDHTASCLYDTGRNMRNIGNGRGKICLMQDAIVLHCNNIIYVWWSYKKKTAYVHSNPNFIGGMLRQFQAVVDSNPNFLGGVWRQSKLSRRLCGGNPNFLGGYVEAIQIF